MRGFTVTCVAILSLVAPVHAAELQGVRFADTVELAGKTLKLNGMGVRTRWPFKAYVAGLYVEEPSKDANRILGGDTSRRVDMVMLRDVDTDTIRSAIRRGFEKGSPASVSAVKERLDTFMASMMFDLKKSDALTFTYVPGEGTTVRGPKGQTGKVPGRDFGDALFAVWLGPNPVDEGLKEGLLGR